jgi:hypothetical protein
MTWKRTALATVPGLVINLERDRRFGVMASGGGVRVARQKMRGVIAQARRPPLESARSGLSGRRQSTRTQAIAIAQKVIVIGGSPMFRRHRVARRAAHR